MHDMAETITPRKSASWLPLVILVAVILVLALAINTWNSRQPQGDLDVDTDNLVTELCEGTPDC